MIPAGKEENSDEGIEVYRGANCVRSEAGQVAGHPLEIHRLSKQVVRHASQMFASRNGKNALPGQPAGMPI